MEVSSKDGTTIYVGISPISFYQNLLILGVEEFITVNVLDY